MGVSVGDGDDGVRRWVVWPMVGALEITAACQEAQQHDASASLRSRCDRLGTKGFVENYLRIRHLILTAFVGVKLVVVHAAMLLPSVQKKKTQIHTDKFEKRKEKNLIHDLLMAANHEESAYVLLF